MKHETPQSEEQLARRLEEAHERLLEEGTLEPEGAGAFEDRELEPARNMLKLIDQVKKTEDRAQNQSTVVGHAKEATLDAGLPGVNIARTDSPFDIDSEIKKISRFDLFEMVGQGGFGLVFRGYDPDLQREVAIKVPRAETLLTEDSRSRFMREAKTAALLSHPNIVTVFESGREGSIHFQVCEFVCGETLASWLSRNRSPVDSLAAANLLITMADAIQHAHDRGVIHRDIKPGNILLADPDNQGIEASNLASVAKISDFGLAKLLTDQSQTRTGAMVGTPAYMSPEQVAKKNSKVTGAADIYSLGVVLYELLTGTTPFKRDKLVQTISAIEQETAASVRQKNPAISKDLDAIVQKCLEKKPESRYLSAADLRSDLKRFLEGEPVQARRITPLVRAGRWVSRNRMVSGLMVLLLAGIVGTTLGLFRSLSAEHEARDAEADAIIEARTADRVSEFLVDLFNIPDGLRQPKDGLQGRDVTAEQIVMNGVQTIKVDLVDEPEIQARLMATLGNVMINMGWYDEAETLFRDVLDIHQNLIGQNDSELGSSHLALGRVLVKKRQYEDAEIQLRTAIEIFEQDELANHRELGKAFNGLGLMLRPQNPTESRAAFFRARDLVIKHEGENSSRLWFVDVNLAAVDVSEGKNEKALPELEALLESGTQELGGDHASLGSVINMLAIVNRRLGNYEKALKLQQLEIKLTEDSLGSEHPDLISGLVSLLSAHQRLGQFEKAIEHGQRAIEIAEKTLEESHPDFIRVLNNHSISLIRAGEYDAARDNVQRAVVLVEPKQDPESIGLFLRNNLVLATVERFDGNTERALEIVNQVIGHPKFQQNQLIVCSALISKSHTLASLGNSEADAVFDDAMAAAKKISMSEGEKKYAEARFFALRGDSESALSTLRQAIQAGFRDAFMKTDPDLMSLHAAPEFLEIVGTLASANQSEN